MEKLEHVKQILAITQSPDCCEDDMASLKLVAVSILTKICASLSPITQLAPMEELPPSNELTPQIAESVSTQSSKRDFRTWVLQRKLESGHPIYFGNEIFKLTIADDKVKMSKVFGDGTVILATTPSGIINSYMMKTTGNKKPGIDGWKRLSMKTETGTMMSIGWSGWLERVWDSESKGFVFE